MPVRGRFAPSPTGALHFGNLRTALIAFFWARESGGEFLIRMEDLDRITSSREVGAQQLEDLASIGVVTDQPVMWQSERFGIYNAVIDELTERGLTYECFCSRREVREAASAPHGDIHERIYPGTCRDLTQEERAERAKSRPAALRLRSSRAEVSLVDVLHGQFVGTVDDVVLRRNDGVPAYNIAVVVDDAMQGVTQVCRGADLLSSTPSHVYLQQILGYSTPDYMHVPLVVGGDGERLSKRNGAKSLRDYLDEGESVGSITDKLVTSIGGAFSIDGLLRVGTWTI
jgi:glutamyl-tRNA synthetase